MVYRFWKFKLYIFHVIEYSSIYDRLQAKLQTSNPEINQFINFEINQNDCYICFHGKKQA